MSNTSIPEAGGKKQSRTVALIIVAATAILLVAGYGWWHSVRSNPQRTLYGVIENNFRVQGVTRNVTQDNSPQKVQQSVALSLSPDAVAHGKTEISQTGSVEAQVKTEAISTPDEEFVRYLDISTTQKNDDGEALDFEELLGVWGKSNSAMTGQPGQTYGEAVLGVVPTGNFNAAGRKALMDIVRSDNVYEFDVNTLQRETVNGRPTYVYDVKVAPTGYIKLLKKYGSLAGMSQLEQLDPSRYEGAEPLTFKLRVDVWSQRLSGIEYAGATRTEALSSYGIRREIDFPTESISVDELQAKLQEAQE